MSTPIILPTSGTVIHRWHPICTCPADEAIICPQLQGQLQRDYRKCKMPRTRVLEIATIQSLGLCKCNTMRLLVWHSGKPQAQGLTVGTEEHRSGAFLSRGLSAAATLGVFATVGIPTCRWEQTRVWSGAAALDSLALVSISCLDRSYLHSLWGVAGPTSFILRCRFRSLWSSRNFMVLSLA